MASKTISITIPEQLEESLQKEADNLGISRSRHIGNILLERQKSNIKINDCDHHNDGYCDFFNIECKAPQKAAETCAGYFNHKGI